MIQHASIRFPEMTLPTGFGFACMKAAYSFRITGRMEYGNSLMVKIDAEGDPDQLSCFIDWIIRNIGSGPTPVIRLSVEKQEKYSEFDLFGFPIEKAF